MSFICVFNGFLLRMLVFNRDKKGCFYLRCSEVFLPVLELITLPRYAPELKPHMFAIFSRGKVLERSNSTAF